MTPRHACEALNIILGSIDRLWPGLHTVQDCTALTEARAAIDKVRRRLECDIACDDALLQEKSYMPEEPITPEHVAYTAYRGRLAALLPAPANLATWAELSAFRQAAWRSAAEAVLVWDEETQQRGQAGPPHPGASRLQATSAPLHLRPIADEEETP